MANSGKRTPKNKSTLTKVTVGLVSFVVAASVAGYLVNNSQSGGFTQPVNANTSEPDGASLLSVDGKIKKAVINDTDVSGLNKDAALTLLDEKITLPLDAQKVTLKYDADIFEYTYSDFGAKYDFEKAVNTVLTTSTSDVSADFSYDKEIVRTVIKDIAGQVDSPAKSASFTRENGEFVTVAGNDGLRVDVDATAEKVYELLDSKQPGEVEVLTNVEKPPVTTEDLADAKSLIGTFTTKTTGGDSPRNINIKNALSKINNVVVYPGGVFSTNYYFGDMTYDNGYRKAPVISGGKLVDDFGGGVCQVSSTLYVALLNAELEIVERQNHSLKVGYADYGYDATLAGNYIDLKFKNDTPRPVLVEGYMSGGSVTVNIYGYEIHDSGHTLKLSNELVSTIPAPADKEVSDNTLPLGQRAVVTAGKNGYRYNLLKTVYENGKETEKVKINTSTYKASAGEVRIGTNPDIKSGTDVPVEIPETNDYNAPDPIVDIPPNAVQTPPSEQPIPSDLMSPELDTSLSNLLNN
ncbi:hydrolase [Clostridia bacterium]|nr:hydrolase [Clostridia bacterium]